MSNHCAQLPLQVCAKCVFVRVCACVFWPLLPSLFHPSFESVCDIQSSNCQVWPPHSSPRPAYQHCVTLTTANYHRDLGFTVALWEYRYISFNKLPTTSTARPRTHTTHYLSTTPSSPPPSHSLLSDWCFYHNIIASASGRESRRCTKCSQRVHLKGGEMNVAPLCHLTRVIDSHRAERDQSRFPIKSAATVTADRRRGQGIKSTTIRIHVWWLGIVSFNDICSYLISVQATNCFILHKRIRSFFF